MTTEQLAIELGNDRKRLRQRLNQAKAVMYREFVAKFKGATFDFENKQLVSNCGRYALAWRLRRWPDRSIDYLNQQSSVGEVYLKGLGQ
jgi:hypothetical protein